MSRVMGSLNLAPTVSTRQRADIAAVLLTAISAASQPPNDRPNTMRSLSPKTSIRSR